MGIAQCLSDAVCHISHPYFIALIYLSKYD